MFKVNRRLTPPMPRHTRRCPAAHRVPAASATWACSGSRRWIQGSVRHASGSAATTSRHKFQEGADWSGGIECVGEILGHGTRDVPAPAKKRRAQGERHSLPSARALILQQTPAGLLDRRIARGSVSTVSCVPCPRDLRSAQMREGLGGRRGDVQGKADWAAAGKTSCCLRDPRRAPS